MICCMTRTEKLEALLSLYIDTASYDLDMIIDKVIAISDTRTYMNATEVGTYLKRNDVTVRTWSRRGTHLFPSPAGHLNGGRTPYWDEADIHEWAKQHPQLLGDADPSEVERRYPPV